MPSWLVTVRLGAHPKCSGARLSSSRLIKSRGSGGDFSLQRRRWMKIQVCFLANLIILSGWHRVWLLLFQGLQITLSIKNVLWTHVFSEWLGWPTPLKQKKAPPNQYNQTQYASAMLFIKQKQIPKTKSAIKSVSFPLLRTTGVFCYSRSKGVAYQKS